MHLQTLAITINQSLIGKVRLLLTMLHHTVRTQTRFFTRKGSGTFLFIRGSAEGLLGTVNRNEQRQGIIVAMASCLLCYMAHSGAIAAYAGKRASSDI